METQVAGERQVALPARPGGPERWKQRLPRLLALLLVAAGVLACGVSGTYSVPDSPETVIRGLAMVSSLDGWAVGTKDRYQQQGLIASYQDGAWKPVALPAATPGLNGVSMLSASDGWAVGVDGVILHYQQGSWEQVQSPTTRTLNSVYMLSSSDGWAVGADILHYQQGVWTLVETAQYSLKSVVMLSAREGWAVGSQGEIRHYTGGQWLAVPAPQEVSISDLNSVTFASPAEGWAVGPDGVILHYHGGAWSNTSLPAGSANFTAVALVSPTEGWAVGTSPTGEGAIVHYTQGHWVQVHSPTTSGWYALDMLSAANGWTGGTQGTLLEYADGEWC